MSTQTFNGNVKIEWDDSVVIVFSFQNSGQTWYGGFVHQVISIQSVTGSQTQISPILQSIQQTAIQASVDPGTWVETIKNGSRGTSNPITVTYDDTINVAYTTQTAQPYQLALIYSIAG